MHNDLDVPTASGEGWQAVELPYRGERVSMLIVLPDAGELAGVERRLARGLLREVTRDLEEERIALALPRFRIDSTHDLGAPLEALGVKDAFDRDRADFRGMTIAERLFVQKAKQKAFVAVDEKGTEAAAATGIVVGAVKAPPPARPFVVDRPFLFVIRDRPTGAVLFSGRVMRP
jgi:serpin B